MADIKIRLRKNAFKRTMILRVVFYTIFLFCSVAVLYLLTIFVNQDSTMYILYILILIPLAFFFQYIIYSVSTGKKISFNNFKNTLMELESVDNIRTGEMDHPVKFLFPEFEQFYKLDDRAIRDKIDLEKLENVVATNYINENKTLQIEMEFRDFISNHLQELLEYDLVIKMKRKGKAIFDDLLEHFPLLQKLVPFTDPAVIFNMENIKNRKLLIFDDSIHHSNSARYILDLIKKTSYEKICFLTVIAQEESLETLKRDYPDVIFLQYKIKNEEEYKKFYSEYMIGYLDHVNRSLENDHTLIKLKIDTLINKEDFMELFNDDKNYVYEVERIVEKVNEYKVSIECPWIYDKTKKSFSKDIMMDMVKVRFFIKLNQPNEIYPYGTTDINLSPALIPHEFDEDFCNKSNMKTICIFDKIITILNKNNIDLNKDIDAKLKDLACINCLINILTNDFVNEFMRHFEKILKEKRKANIIEKNIFSPYPQEIYRVKY